MRTESRPGDTDEIGGEGGNGYRWHSKWVTTLGWAAFRKVHTMKINSLVKYQKDHLGKWGRVSM